MYFLFRRYIIKMFHLYETSEVGCSELRRSTLPQRR
nr:MAG TPA: hypothetical protein [Caudoviricetes sp.]